MFQGWKLQANLVEYELIIQNILIPKFVVSNTTRKVNETSWIRASEQSESCFIFYALNKNHIQKCFPLSSALQSNIMISNIIIIH